MANGRQELGRDEVVYRRIPDKPNFYNPENDERPSPEAFRPRPDDLTGISFQRRGFKSVAGIGRGQPGKSYWIVGFRVSDLNEHGIRIVADEQEGDPGHAEIPELNYDDRKSDEAEGIKVKLAEKVPIAEMHGPYVTPELAEPPDDSP